MAGRPPHGNGAGRPNPMGAPRPVVKLDVPRFSTAERDRRWGRVRELMARENIDVIVAPVNTGQWEHLAANSRYLSSIGGNCSPVATVFPREGDVTAITGPVPTKEHWLGYQDWVTDVRPVFFSLSDAVVQRLQELGAERWRIGVAGLAGLPRLPEGSVSHGTFLRLEQGFPDAEIVNATGLLEEARFVKGDEEIAFLQRSTELVEQSLDVLTREARPGVRECEVYARMLASQVEAGGDMPTLILWASGNPQPMRNYFQPTMRKLEAGDFISTECEARWGGYCGHITTQAILGSPPPEYHDMFKVQQEALNRCRERARPGALLGEFIDIAAEASEGTPYRCQIIMHGRGLGDDAPMTIFGTQFGGQDERMKSWRLERNAVLLIKPLVMTPDWQKWVCWGDPVVVEEGGGRRLSSRTPEIIEIG
ncbi:MAG: aminopeptidase P family protein [Candidatus Dormibacteraeota bacterium]|nr:aminopeptidase P family protein [Candidatus Dormibacteraeota bacterium]